MAAVQTSHQASVPSVALKYFGPDSSSRERHPLIEEVFVPGKGWKRSGWKRKLVSLSAVRKLRSQEGVTHVALRSSGRLADFSVAELLGTDKRDLRSAR